MAGAREADLDAWAEALRVIEGVDRTGEVLGCADLAEQLALSFFDLARDARLGWADGRVVAWGTAMCIPNPRQRRVDLAGAVVPSFRGQGIGTALVGWQIGRGREIVDERAEATPAWLELSAAQGDHPRGELFREFGFTPHRYFHEMRRSLREPPPAVEVGPDLHVAPFDFARDEQTRQAHNEAFLDHIESTELDPEMWATWVTGERQFRADCSILVLAGDDIAGYALCGVHPDDWPSLGFTEGWIHHLGVRRPWRGRGVAKALLRAERVRVRRRRAGLRRTRGRCEEPHGCARAL